MTKMHHGFKRLLSKYLENVKDMFRLQKLAMLIFSADKRKELENTDFSISWKSLNFLKQKKWKTDLKKRVFLKEKN